MDPSIALLAGGLLAMLLGPGLLNGGADAEGDDLDDGEPPNGDDNPDIIAGTEGDDDIDVPMAIGKQVYGLGGNDRITMDFVTPDARKPAIAEGGIGNDSLSGVSAQYGPLDPSEPAGLSEGGVIFDGGLGDDHLTLTASTGGRLVGGSGNDIIKIDNRIASRPATPFFAQEPAFVIEAGADDDEIHVDNGALYQDPLTISGGAGADKFQFSPWIADEIDEDSYNSSINRTLLELATITDFERGVDSLTFDVRESDHMTVGDQWRTAEFIGMNVTDAEDDTHVSALYRIDNHHVSMIQVKLMGVSEFSDDDYTLNLKYDD
ncbi:hypothetical protein SAMN05421538_10213 [Paracoccus isoporae]|uniref:Hemolysin-type calcium-binding repeat-containing protein n=1 Tax=Paracoccus isoporae TaxID=591205 RepID=A0A1G6W3T5_9RHOB|nr:hypothetical protein [Paracoccus isoporae]SDD59877.1 hypothetical protein SAMN05421538_10213 [Paracoccus isoporae]